MKCIFAIKRLENAAGGAEKVLTTICSILADKGYNIKIVTFDNPHSTPFYPLSIKVKLIELGLGDPSKSLDIFKFLKCIASLRKVLKSEKPDIVVGFMHSLYVPLTIAAIGTKIRVYGSEHITIDHYKSRPIELLSIIITAPFIKKITVLSKNIGKKYPEIIRKRMIPIVNPIESPDIKACTKLKSDRKIILNIGRLNEQKDHLTLISAFSNIAKIYPNWDLRIVGEGELRSMLENEIKKLLLEQRISLPGITKTISYEYINADIFVNSSVYEAFGLVTAEAMSYGLPVIGFADCPGTNELIKNEENGILVEGGNNKVQNLSDMLIYLINDYKKRNKLGQLAKKYIDQNFSNQEVVCSWEKMLYNN